MWFHHTLFIIISFIDVSFWIARDFYVKFLMSTDFLKFLLIKFNQRYMFYYRILFETLPGRNALILFKLNNYLSKTTLKKSVTNNHENWMTTWAMKSRKKRRKIYGNTLINDEPFQFTNNINTILVSNIVVIKDMFSIQYTTIYWFWNWTR